MKVKTSEAINNKQVKISQQDGKSGHKHEKSMQNQVKSINRWKNLNSSHGLLISNSKTKKSSQYQVNYLVKLN